MGVYVIVWLAFDLGSFNWQSAATVATWIMTLFIQRAEHRDTQAIHAKLDELLRAEGKARDELTMVDRCEPEEIEAHRQMAQRHRLPAGEDGEFRYEIRSTLKPFTVDQLGQKVREVLS